MKPETKEIIGLIPFLLLPVVVVFIFFMSFRADRILCDENICVAKEVKEIENRLDVRIRDLTRDVNEIKKSIKIVPAVASWYGDQENGRLTASGQIFHKDSFTAAHRTLPFGTVVVVEMIGTGEAYPAIINDRGPFIAGRDIDLSEALAKKLGFHKAGVANVLLHIVYVPIKEKKNG
jgi:rare lipoprotein A (peptidoglycan hydrolase)